MNEQLQFDEIMQMNFPLAAEDNFGVIDPMEAYADALVQQNLQFGNLSLDDPYTRQVIDQPEAIESLMAPNYVVEALGYASMYASSALFAEVQDREFSRMYQLFANNDDSKHKTKRDTSYAKPVSVEV